MNGIIYVMRFLLDLMKYTGMHPRTHALTHSRTHVNISMNGAIFINRSNRAGP